MRKQPLQVNLHVREPSVVELTVGDKVQLDRLVPSSRGYVAQRHGDLLDAGVATLALEPGFYFFKTLSNANLKVIRGGVHTVATSITKDPPPPPLSAPGSGPPASPAPLDSRGDERPGELPLFTVEG